MFSRLTSVFRLSSDDPMEQLEENTDNPITSTTIATNCRMQLTEKDPENEKDADPEEGALFDSNQCPQTPVNDQNSTHSSSPSSSSCENSDIEVDSRGLCDIQTQSKTSTISSQWSQDYMKSVSVQCDPVEVVSKCVQYEPVLQVTKSVQCDPVSRVSQSVQCDPVSRVSQSVQYEPILHVDQSVQCDLVLGVSQSVQCENTSGTLLKAQDLNCDLICTTEPHQSKSDNEQYTSNRFILLPPLPKELNSINVVSSSQTSICESTSESSQSLVHNESMETIQNEYSEGCDSTKSPSENSIDNNKIPGARKNLKRKGKNVRNTNKRKLLVVRDENEQTSLPNLKEKCDEDYTADELLEEMGTSKEFLVNKEDNRNSKCNETEKCGEVNSENSVDNNKIPEACENLKRKGKRDEDYTSDELLEEMGTSKEFLVNKEDNRNSKCNESKSTEAKKTNQISIQEMQENSLTDDVGESLSLRNPPCNEPPEVEQTQPRRTCQWFNSLACERASSPESIADETLEELRTRRSYCYRQLYLKLDGKNTSCLEEKGDDKNNRQISGDNSEHLRSRKESDDKHFPETPGPSLSAKSKKLSHEVNKSKELSTSCNLIVPYSESESEGSNSDTSNSCNRDSSRLRSQDHKKLQNSSIRKEQSVRIPQPESPIQSTSNMNTKRNPKSKPSIELVKHKPVRDIWDSVSESESEGSNPDTSNSCNRDSSRLRSQDHKKLQNSSLSKEQSAHIPQPKSPIRSVSNMSTKTNPKSKPSIELVKHKPLRDIWDSDNGNSDDDQRSHVSTVTYKSTRTYKTTSTRSSYRQPYIREEREAILWYIIDHKYFNLVKGRAMWERMEKANICPERTWQSMKEHFIKRILPNLGDFHLHPTVLKRFQYKK